MPSKKPEPKKKGKKNKEPKERFQRVKAQVANVKAVKENPRFAGTLFRRWFLALWKARGGGFYGLGFVITFVILEVKFFVVETAESVGVADLATNLALDLLVRFGIQTFINTGLAFAWPAYLVQLGGGLGIALLVGGFIFFDRLFRPAIESYFPELRPDPKDDPKDDREDESTIDEKARK